MFIYVMYGKNESLICNPCCAVINLLNSIQKRTGYSNPNFLLDLSDETGLIKELDTHKNEYASKHLLSHGTYILVKKLLLPNGHRNDDALDGAATDHDFVSTIDGIRYQYIPLLDKHTEMFPDYKIHLSQVDKKKIKKPGIKGPSPAGRFTTKSKKGSNKTLRKK